MAINIPANFGQGYGQAVANKQENYRNAVNSLLSVVQSAEDKYNTSVTNELSSALTPLEQAGALGVDSWNALDADQKPLVNFQSIDSSGKAYLDWKTQLEKDGGRGLKYAKKNNLLNPIAFKQEYDKQISANVPLIAEQLLNYKMSNGKTDAEMRDIIGKNTGLKELLINTGYGAPMLGEADNPLYPMLAEQPGFLSNAWGAVTGNPLMSAAAGYGLYRAGKAYAPGMSSWAQGKMPAGFKWPGGGASAAAGGGTGQMAFNFGQGTAGSPIPKGGQMSFNFGQGGTASKSQVNNVINKLGGKSKVVQMLSNTMGKSAALKFMGSLLTKGALPLSILQFLWMVGSQDKDKYKQAQRANLDAVLNASRVNISGVR